MMRAAYAMVMMGLAQASPAMAMPNAFWIFGFHVPGKHGPKSSIVMTRPADQQAARLLPAETTGNEASLILDVPPHSSVQPQCVAGCDSITSDDGEVGGSELHTAR